MTAHELARQLLEGPDVQVLTYDRDGNLEHDVTVTPRHARSWNVSGDMTLCEPDVPHAVEVVVIF